MRWPAPSRTRWSIAWSPFQQSRKTATRSRGRNSGEGWRGARSVGGEGRAGDRAVDALDPRLAAVLDDRCRRRVGHGAGVHRLRGADGAGCFVVGEVALGPTLFHV